MGPLPPALLVACLCLAISVLLTATGIVLGMLPEDIGLEWNGLPVSEYGLSDLAGGIVLFGLAAALLAGVHLLRNREEAAARRRLARGLLFAGLVPFVAVALIVALALAICSGGACE